jgi:hypothetical protein
VDATAIEIRAIPSVGQKLLDNIKLSGNLDITIHSAQTAPVIFLDVDGTVGYSYIHSLKSEANIIVHNATPSTNHAYPCIKLQAKNGNIWGCDFGNIITDAVGNGILFNVLASGWINGNSFRDIKYDGFVVGVDFQGVANNSNENFFENIQFQTKTYSTDVFKNITNRNTIIYCPVWDWGNASSPNYVYSIAANEYGVHIYSTEALTRTTVSNLGYNNRIVHPFTTDYKYKKVLVVSGNTSDVNTKYSTIKAALDFASSEGASATDRWLVIVYGKITETSGPYAKDYVDVIGYNAIVELPDMVFTVPNTITDCRISGVHFKTTGTISALKTLTDYSTSVDVKFDKCKFENTATNGHGAYIYGGCANRFTNCDFIGIVRGLGIENSIAEFNNCRFSSSSTSGWCGGVLAYGYDASKFIGCDAVGATGGNAYGWSLSGQARTILEVCSGTVESATSKIFAIADSASPLLSDCITKLPQYYYEWTYTSSDSGRFRPLSSQAYSVVGAILTVSIARVGETVSLGTSPGGCEIASGISIATTGSKYFSISRAHLAADAYLYATPTGGSDGDFIVKYIIVKDFATCYAISIEGYGFPRIAGGRFSSNGLSDCINIAITNKNYLLAGVAINSLNPANDAISAGSAITGEQFKNCAIESGTLSNVTGIDNKSSGSSTGTGSEQTIAHGLASAPSNVVVTFQETGGVLTSVWADATNIYVNANAKAYKWNAEV